MTAGHMILAVALTAYIVVAIQLEERNLEDAIGESYARYRQSTPMLIPRLTPALPKTVTSEQRG